jgi:putative transcriptional regulator
MRQELYDARKEYGLTQEQLALASGIERTTYNRIERGTRKPDIDIALRIANALNKTVEDIFLSSYVLNEH